MKQLNFQVNTGVKLFYWMATYYVHFSATMIAPKCHRSSKIFLGGVVLVEGSKQSILASLRVGDLALAALSPLTP